MSEEKRQILEMLAQGKIQVSEAEQLLGAVGQGAVGAGGGAKPKYLRVMVENGGEHGEKINVRIPMQLLRAGVRLASLIPPIAHVHVNRALKEHGIQMDLASIKPSDLEDLVEHLGDLTVDVDGPREKVRVFCE